MRAAAALANDAEAERIRDAVSVMLGDRGFRENASRVRPPLAGLDGAVEVADAMEVVFR